MELSLAHTQLMPRQFTWAAQAQRRFSKRGRMPDERIRLALLLALLLTIQRVCAQDRPTEPCAPPQVVTGTQRTELGVAPVVEERERVLFVVPAFDVTNRTDAPPFRARHKFALAARQGFDPFFWTTAAIQAGLSQRSNQFPEYGQGMRGYNKRYGAAMLDNVDGGLASTAFRVLLKQDPRYFRVGRGSVTHRILYSLAQEFSTKSDRGTRQFNWSRLLGTLSGAAIANIYYPKPNRGLGLTFNRFGNSILWDPPGLLTDEFWPDIRSHFFDRGKHQN